MSARDPAKRVPKSLGTETKLFGTYTLTDVAVALFPGVLVILLLQVAVPTGLTLRGYPVRAFALPFAGVAICAGGLFVYLTPAYTTSFDWFGTFLGYRRRDSELSHEAAKQHTQIERVRPDHGAVERTDGAFIGLIQVDPPTMALATEKEWAEQSAAFREFLNTTVEFPIQIFSTTQAFPADRYLSAYESRLDDPDVKANPQLAALLEHYVEWYAHELDDRRMTIRDHYVVVPVTPREVQFDHASLTRKLARVPIAGSLLRAWLAPRQLDQQAAMADALGERLRRVETGLREIEGCRTTAVEPADAARIVGEFWAGRELDYGDMNRVLRTRPIVAGGDR